jgi:hypothetical protein
MPSAERRLALLESLLEIGQKFNYRNLAEERYSVPSSKTFLWPVKCMGYSVFYAV